MWEALRVSGQAVYYEDSDWATAELLMVAIDTFVERPTAGMLTAIDGFCASLLITEGDRRRARLELKRPSESAEPVGSVPDLDDYRKRLERGAS